MNCPWFHLRLTLLCQHLILWCSSSDSLPSLLHPQFPPNRSSQLASKQDVIYLTLKNKKHFLTTILHFSPFRYSETIANIGLWFHFLSSCFFLDLLQSVFCLHCSMETAPIMSILLNPVVILYSSIAINSVFLKYFFFFLLASQTLYKLLVSRSFHLIALSRSLLLVPPLSSLSSCALAKTQSLSLFSSSFILTQLNFTALCESVSMIPFL